MMQLSNFPNGGGNTTNYLYVETEDKRISSESTTVYYLAELTSEMTNISLTVILTKGTINERYSKLGLVLSNTTNTDSLKRGAQLNIGNVEGFYDVIIYEQTSSTNLSTTDGSVKGVVHKGIAYLTNAVSEVSFTEYDTTIQNTVYVSE
jgi:tRNA G10  N-methylase Trm11